MVEEAREAGSAGDRRISLVPAYLHAYSLSGPSDIPTALLGDKVIVNSAAYQLKLPYSNATLFRTALPKRGDFVLLHVPNNSRLRFGFFKRIMALPGETIEIRENRVVVNGRAIPVRDLDPADFAWVPTGHPMGSTVQARKDIGSHLLPARANAETFPRFGC